MKSESELADYVQVNPESCIFLHTANCMLYCYQCDLELYDYSVDVIERRSLSEISFEGSRVSKEKGHTYLDLRKLFVKHEIRAEKRTKGTNLAGKIGHSALLPLNSLQTVLVVLYSIDYIRKLLKKRHISNTYTVQHYGVNLFPALVSKLGATLFSMGRPAEMDDQIESLYQLLLKYEPSLSSYSYTNLYVN